MVNVKITWQALEWSARGKGEADSQDIMKAPLAYLTGSGGNVHTQNHWNPTHSNPDIVAKGREDLIFRLFQEKELRWGSPYGHSGEGRREIRFRFTLGRGEGEQCPKGSSHPLWIQESLPSPGRLSWALFHLPSTISGCVLTILKGSPWQPPSCFLFLWVWLF